MGEDAPLGAGQHGIDSHIAGNLWQVQVSAGQQVAAGDVLVIVESMKMEIPVEAEAAGTVRQLLVAVGEQIAEGQAVAEIE